MRKCFTKLQPRIINYRSYKNFLDEKFKSCLLNKLRKEDFVSYDKGFEMFCNTSMKVLNKLPPWMKNYARCNQIPFMMKDLSKEIMKKS